MPFIACKQPVIFDIRPTKRTPVFGGYILCMLKRRLLELKMWVFVQMLIRGAVSETGLLGQMNIESKEKTWATYKRICKCHLVKETECRVSPRATAAPGVGSTTKP